MKKIIFATGNNGKLIEVKNLFGDSGFEVVAPFELGNNIDVEETGATFEENSTIKALAIYEIYKVPVVADDSGLEVQQLNGKPGVYSARYAGENCTYDDNNNKLLEELYPLPQPHKARFVSCAVYYDGVNKLVANGYLDGTIIHTKRGTNGFGYDPIFKPYNFDITLAEMNLDEKNKISHRKNSFIRLKEMILAL
jgi:XTP/dITP diphosphohydrolase